MNLDQVGDKMVKLLVKELSKYNLGNSELANSIKYKINKNIIQIDMNEYGIYLDSGTGPRDKMPPFKAINQWAKDKNLNTWAVMYSIKENGTKAKPFLNVLDDIDLSEAILDDIEVQVEIQFKNIFQ